MTVRQCVFWRRSSVLLLLPTCSCCRHASLQLICRQCIVHVVFLTRLCGRRCRQVQVGHCAQPGWQARPLRHRSHLFDLGLPTLLLLERCAISADSSHWSQPWHGCIDTCEDMDGAYQQVPRAGGYTSFSCILPSCGRRKAYLSLAAQEHAQSALLLPFLRGTYVGRIQ